MIARFRNNAVLIQKVYDRSMEPLCEQYHMTRMEMDILLFLANNPGYDTAKDIVEQKRFTKSHVSSSVRLLEEKGYLKGEFRPGNHKTIHLTLLPASDEIVKAGQIAQRKIFSGIFDGLTPEQLDMLKKILEQINQNLLQAYKEV